MPEILNLGPRFIFPLVQSVFIKPMSPRGEDSAPRCQSTLICVKYERGQRQRIVAGGDERSSRIKLFWFDPAIRETKDNNSPPRNYPLTTIHNDGEICREGQHTLICTRRGRT